MIIYDMVDLVVLPLRLIAAFPLIVLLAILIMADKTPRRR